MVLGRWAGFRSNSLGDEREVNKKNIYINILANKPA